MIQSDFVGTLIAWAVAVLIYPGLLFAVALMLGGEWVLSALRPLLTSRTRRVQSRPRSFLQPFYDVRQLAGRTPTSHSLFRAAQLVAPLLAFAVLPFPGNPVGPTAGNLLLVPGLLAVQPMFSALLRLDSSDLFTYKNGAQIMGRLVNGLFPVLAAVAALAEIGQSKSLYISGLGAAPQSAGQASVRLLAGAALLVALPFWLDARGLQAKESAPTYAGRLLQRGAIAAFWTLLVLPMPGDLPWAALEAIAGTLFSYIAMRLVAARIAPTLRERDITRFVWATAGPLAAASLAIAFMWGA